MAKNIPRGRKVPAFVIRLRQEAPWPSDPRLASHGPQPPWTGSSPSDTPIPTRVVSAPLTLVGEWLGAVLVRKPG